MKRFIALLLVVFSIFTLFAACGKAKEHRKGPGNDTGEIETVLPLVTRAPDTEEIPDVPVFKSGVWFVYDGDYVQKEYEFTDNGTGCTVFDNTTGEGVVFEYAITTDGQYRFYFGATQTEKIVDVTFDGDELATIHWEDGDDTLEFAHE